MEEITACYNAGENDTLQVMREKIQNNVNDDDDVDDDDIVGEKGEKDGVLTWVSEQGET